MGNMRDIKALKKIIEDIQKEVFGLTTPMENLLSLYKYPTSKVDLFFKKIENAFNIKFEERPDTLSALISEIILASNKSYWK